MTWFPIIEDRHIQLVGTWTLREQKGCWDFGLHVLQFQGRTIGFQVFGVYLWKLSVMLRPRHDLMASQP